MVAEAETVMGVGIDEKQHRIGMGRNDVVTRQQACDIQQLKRGLRRKLVLF